MNSANAVLYTDKLGGAKRRTYQIVKGPRRIYIYTKNIKNHTNRRFELGLSGCRIDFIDIGSGASVLRDVEFEYDNPTSRCRDVELLGMSN